MFIRCDFPRPFDLRPYDTRSRPTVQAKIRQSASRAFPKRTHGPRGRTTTPRRTAAAEGIGTLWRRPTPPRPRPQERLRPASHEQAPRRRGRRSPAASGMEIALFRGRRVCKGIRSNLYLLHTWYKCHLISSHSFVDTIEVLLK